MFYNGYIVLVMLAVGTFCALGVKSAATNSVISDVASAKEYHSYDQRQTGDTNVRVTLDGAKLILHGLPSFSGLLDSFLGKKRTKNDDRDERRSKNLVKIRTRT
jgi:hypothetical protein